LRLKILKKLRTASLNSEFTGSYKKVNYIKIFPKNIMGVVKISCLLKNLINWAFIDFSRTLDKLGRSEIGL